MRHIISDYRFLLSMYKAWICCQSRTTSYKISTVSLLITLFRAY